MRLTIVLSKEVPDTDIAQTIVNFVKLHLEAYPEVTINANCSEKIVPIEPE